MEKQKEVSEQVAETKEQPTLTLADLVSMLQVVDVATNRGAFKAQELSTVGGLYDRVSAYVKHVSPQEKTTKGVQEEAAKGE
jgi:hypothetical protein